MLLVLLTYTLGWSVHFNVLFFSTLRHSVISKCELSSIHWWSNDSDYHQITTGVFVVCRIATLLIFAVKNLTQAPSIPEMGRSIKKKERKIPNDNFWDFGTLTYSTSYVAVLVQQCQSGDQLFFILQSFLQCRHLQKCSLLSEKKNKKKTLSYRGANEYTYPCGSNRVHYYIKLRMLMQ